MISATVVNTQTHIPEWHLLTA